MEECGLPRWFVSGRSWTNMDISLHFERVVGSTRSMKMTNYYFPRKAFNFRRANNDRRFVGNRRREEMSRTATNSRTAKYISKYLQNDGGDSHTKGMTSQITCHKILSGGNEIVDQENSYTKLVAYQKLGW